MTEWHKRSVDLKIVLIKARYNISKRFGLQITPLLFDLILNSMKDRKRLLFKYKYVVCDQNQIQNPCLH